MASLATSIFLGAFLLFQVQPIIARYILPWFGGSPAVWTTAMLFFQVMLLAGYAYTHFIVARLGLKRQVILHLSLLIFSLALLPITPADSWKPGGQEDPLWQIVLLLSVAVGMPYVMVSATTPLMQSWFARVYPDRSPYGLYALSNIGSMLGLLAYPFIVEPLLGVHAQTVLWSVGFGVFVLVSLWTALPIYRLAGGKSGSTLSLGKGAPVPWTMRGLWLALSALGVVVLLATTNQLCKDVAVVPLLWVLPLTLYLLSFIVAFGKPAWYYRPLWIALLAASTVAVVYLLREDYGSGELHLYFQIAIYSAVVLTCCMVCHGELYRLRPPTQHLTLFYLVISLGGALGGVFVNIIAPQIFLGYWEFHACLVATVLLLGVCLLRDRGLQPRPWVRWTMASGWLVGIVWLVFYLGGHIQEQQDETIDTRRNFYGVLRVYEFEEGTVLHSRSLYHGRIEHGKQYLKERLRQRPLTYYGSGTGVEIAVKTKRNLLVQRANRRTMRIGVVGQGASTIAAYARYRDTVRFYEIDPDVSEISDKYFSYRTDTRAKTEVVLGDARISMERELKDEQPQEYDVLVIDAFSGDGIPVHLLTREAIAVYRQHLAEDGVIALHISNLHFDLHPVALGLAEDAGMHALSIDVSETKLGESRSDWVLLTDDRIFVEVVKDQVDPWPETEPRTTLWTDDFANVLEVVSD